MNEEEKNAINDLENLSLEEKEDLLKCIVQHEIQKSSGKNWAVAMGVLLVLLFLIALTLFLPEKYLLRYVIILGIIFFICWSRKKCTAEQQDETDIIENIHPDDDIPLPPMNEKDMSVTALHEAGHAVCAHFLPGFSEMEQIQIAEDNKRFCGAVSFKKPDRRTFSESVFKNMIAAHLSGILAEKMVFREVSCGAEHDLAAASRLAYDMTTTLGMGKRGGLFAIPRDGNFFKSDMEADIREIISEAQALAEKTLTEHLDLVKKLAQLLMEKKSLNEDEIKEFFAGEAPSAG